MENAEIRLFWYYSQALPWQLSICAHMEVFRLVCECGLKTLPCFVGCARKCGIHYVLYDGRYCTVSIFLFDEGFFHLFPGACLWHTRKNYDTRYGVTRLTKDGVKSKTWAQPFVDIENEKFPPPKDDKEKKPDSQLFISPFRYQLHNVTEELASILISGWASIGSREYDLTNETQEIHHVHTALPLELKKWVDERDRTIENRK